MSIPQKVKKRLKAFELRDLLNGCRDRLRLSQVERPYWGPVIKKLVEHVYWLEHELLEREREIREFRQPELFAEMERKRQPPPPPPEVPPRLSFEERGYHALCAGKKEFDLFLKWDASRMKTSEENLTKIILTWAKEHGKVIPDYEP